MVGDVSAAAAWALGIACAGGCASTEQSNRPPGPAPTRGRLNLPAVTSDSRLTAVRSLNFEPMLHTFPGHLPPLKTVQVALRKTTETLAHWLARPTPDVPDWSDFEWRVARAAAALHGVSPILSSQSRGSVPVGWQMFLDEQRAHTSKRYLRIKELLQLVDDGARVAGIPFVALKGAALYELALYAAGERPMADLDLLVRAQHVERMAETLQSVGFAQSASTLKHRVFESAEGGQAARFGEDFRNGIKIDLHVGIREYLPRHAVDVSGLMMPLQPRPGINPYRSPSALMLHLLLHAAGAIVLRTLRLVQLHDMALLSRRMSDVDWEELLRQAASARCGLWWAYAPLRLVAHYYQTIPAPILAAAAAECHPSFLCRSHKRYLCEVSFSDLRRQAFPGIEWSRSRRDALAYVAERVQLALRVLARTVATGAVIGGVDGIAGRGGHTLPAGGWIALRPARPATLFAVRHALAQPH